MCCAIRVKQAKQAGLTPSKARGSTTKSLHDPMPSANPLQADVDWSFSLTCFMYPQDNQDGMLIFLECKVQITTAERFAYDDIVVRFLMS